MEAGAAGLSEGSTSKADAGSDELAKTSVMVDVETRVAEGITPIAPITPLPVKEVRDNRAPTPFSQCRLAKIDAENAKQSECGSLCTPKQGVFDPGPDDMPKLQEKTGESRVSVVRQLDFDSSSLRESSGSSDEENLLELVCGDILHVIVPGSADLDEAEKVDQEEAESDGFKTPPLVSCFNGIGNKCPDAPMKQGRTMSERLHIDASLCRKLEF